MRGFTGYSAGLGAAGWLGRVCWGHVRWGMHLGCVLLRQHVAVSAAVSSARTIKAVRRVPSYRTFNLQRQALAHQRPVCQLMTWLLRTLHPQAGCMEAVQLLLLMEAGAAACGSKALVAAAEAGHDAVVEALLAAGADATARENAPLIGAARWGRTAVVRRLLAAGADPCARDSWALWAASEAGHMETVAVLMAAGADPAVPMDEEAAGFDVASLINEMECDG